MNFVGGITNSLLKEFQPMVHTSLPYHGNVPSSKTIFRVTFFKFLIFECNFWYLQAPIWIRFYMVVVHDVRYLQLKFCRNRSTLRGVTTCFFNYTKKKRSFLIQAPKKFHTIKIFSRVHATLHPALSICTSVRWSVGPAHFFFFYQFYFFKSFKSTLSHSKSTCKSRTWLIGVGLVYMELN